jgi:threonine aldolase
MKNFVSDNHAGVPPEILKAIQRANEGYALAYGDDEYTAAAVEKFREQLGPDIDVYFVFIGTAANVLGLKAITQPYHSIICAETAHINVDECGAPERFTGCKLVAIPTVNGKLTPELVSDTLQEIGNQHHNQPRVISISESSELGTVYTPAEIKSLTDFAHQNGLLLHMDGARIANAAASLHCKLREITSDVGVDVLSFGGTKNGLMFGEAVIFFNQTLGEDFKYIRKQGLQLMSKMRFLAVQFEALLTDDLWLRNARRANEMAQILASEIATIPQIKITQKVEANAVFAIIPPQYIPRIQAKYLFGVWNEKTSEVRLMTSFETTTEDITDFIRVIKDSIQNDKN